MADVKECCGHVSTGSGVCLEVSCLPSWVVVQTILFLISTGLTVFDTWTDWEVVMDFQEVGFKNPLLPHNITWLRAWYLFTSIGTFLTVISFLHDGMGLLYSVYLCCYKEDEKVDKDEKVDDPCKCCYRHGWNEKTRSETLSAIALWFQDIPMLILAILYAHLQRTCKVPDSRDVTPILLDVAISATAAMIVSF